MEKCPLCFRDNGTCFIKEQLKIQSKSGRFVNKIIKTDGGGHYWEKETWKKYIQNATTQARTRGCLQPKEVEQEAKEVTDAKTAAGELI